MRNSNLMQCLPEYSIFLFAIQYLLRSDRHIHKLFAELGRKSKGRGNRQYRHMQLELESVLELVHVLEQVLVQMVMRMV